MDNDSFQNKRKDMIVRRKFDQLSSLVSSFIYQTLISHRTGYAILLISISMLFLFLGTAFVESTVFKFMIFMIFTIIAAPVTAFAINMDKTFFTIKNIFKNGHLDAINSSKTFYKKIDPFENDEDIKMLMGKEDYNLLKFMDTYVEEKSLELQEYVEDTFTEVKLSSTSLLHSKTSGDISLVNEKRVKQLQNFIREYEDTIDIFNQCKLSMLMIHVIENSSDMSIEDLKYKIDNIQDGEDVDRIKRTGFYIGNTVILADDIQDMLNDKETVKFMMEIYGDEYLKR